MNNKNRLNVVFLVTSIICFVIMLINVNTWIGLQNFGYHYGGSGVIDPIAGFMEDMPFVVTLPVKGATLVFILVSLIILAIMFILGLKGKSQSTNKATFKSATLIFSVYAFINILVLLAYFR